MLPIAQEAPLWTVGWLFVWYAESHPSGIAEKGVELASTATSFEAGAEAAGEGIKAAEDGVKTVEEGTKAAGGVGKGIEKEVEGTEKAGMEAEVANKTATEAKENARAAKAGEDSLPENARDPMDVLGENIDMPSGDFMSWNGDGGQSDDEGEVSKAA